MVGKIWAPFILYQPAQQSVPQLKEAVLVHTFLWLTKMKAIGWRGPSLFGEFCLFDEQSWIAHLSYQTNSNNLSAKFLFACSFYILTKHEWYTTQQNLVVLTASLTITVTLPLHHHYHYSTTTTTTLLLQLHHHCYTAHTSAWTSVTSGST